MKKSCSKKPALKTREEKDLFLVNEKLFLELPKIKEVNKRFNFLKEKSNKKMEGHFFYLPNINLVRCYNEHVNKYSPTLTADQSLLLDFTKNNNICNKERCQENCMNYCYCEKGRFQSNNISSRFNILLELLKDSKKFWNRIDKQIKYEEVDLLRIHTEGDFFGKDYVDQWFDIINQNVNTTFYGYTKQFEHFDHIQKLPDNFYLELSFDTRSTYDIPLDLLEKGNVNIYLTYRTMDEVETFVNNNKLQHMEIVSCQGERCKKCRNCYTGKNRIILCKLH